MLKAIFRRFWRLPIWGRALIVLVGLAGIGAMAYFLLTLYSNWQSNSGPYIDRWFDDPDSRAQIANDRAMPCHDAPFLLPTDGLIGLLWRDSSLPYNIFRRHTGLDIFGNGDPGEVPVYAAYEGYLTRLPDWKSTVIIRHDDPLHPGQTIWTYYTHMASKDGNTSFIVDDFPPGMAEVWVEQGTLIGYQGIYAGRGVPVGLHLHFSIIKSEKNGSFKNEAKLGNTLDPSPYFGLPLNVKDRPKRPILCE